MTSDDHATETNQRMGVRPADALLPTPSDAARKADEPLRVLQVMGSSAGGVVRHVVELAHLLAGTGMELAVAAPASARGAVMAAGIEFIEVDIADRPRRSDFAVRKQLKELGRRFDIMHAHGLRAGALTVLGVKGLRRHKPWVVVTEHNLAIGSRQVRMVSAVLEQSIAKRANVVMGVSRDLVERAISYGAKRTELAVVPAPPRAEASAGRDELRADLLAGLGAGRASLLLVTVARLAPQKGLDLLCDAAGILERQAPGSIRWLVAGDGPLSDHLAERISRENLPVTALGRRSDIADLLTAADVIVSTSQWEGQPLVLQEALAAGAPIVATDVGGTYAVTGEAALLVSYPDAQALADVIGGLLENPARRRDLAERSLLRSLELPTPNDVLTQIRRVYDPSWNSQSYS